jgi:hypothetical protein
MRGPGAAPDVPGTAFAPVGPASARASVPNNDAYGRYLLAVAEAAGVEVRQCQFDTGDVFGTAPFVFWTLDAAEAARRMAPLVTEDIHRLRLERGKLNPTG